MGRFFKRIIFLFNVLAALVMVVAFVLPYLPPSKFPLISVLSLGVPLLILVNIIFALFWLILLNKRFLLSFSVLFISFFYFNVFYEISSEGDPSEYGNTLSILSYNVRLFNAFEKKDSSDVLGIFSEIVTKSDPDIIFIQEYYRDNKMDFSSYPYQYKNYKSKRAKLGQAIFSKYPLVNTGAFDFEDSSNDALYADVIIGKDTIRLYNVHLQSFGIIPEVQFLQESDKEKLLRRISANFKKQEAQIHTVLEHKAKTNHTVILCGDFNNTPFSYTYRKFKDEMQDGFRERGNGLGTTFWFDRFPLRIDYIFASQEFDFLTFETFKETFSDHQAIHATVGW
jgi:endonuclease/exonuclease/phosphatase family metal-dependent hydrolase